MYKPLFPLLFLIIVVIALILGFIRSAQRAKMKKRKRYKQRSENSRRYNYKKRSENKHRKEPIENSKGNKGLYTEPLYKNLSARAESAANTEMYNEIYDYGPDDGGYYDEEEMDYEYGQESAYTDINIGEEAMYQDYPQMRGYGVQLHPLDDPSRWEE